MSPPTVTIDDLERWVRRRLEEFRARYREHNNAAVLAELVRDG